MNEVHMDVCDHPSSGPLAASLPSHAWALTSTSFSCLRFDVAASFSIEKELSQLEELSAQSTAQHGKMTNETGFRGNMSPSNGTRLLSIDGQVSSSIS